mmetsp:Transcript_43669/g.98344  ORF Transcript_43669/g.98344 Transcript_43669/m.98344 type:complete len:287 (-) Transcript_43669:786-1646(-)
MSSCMAPAAQVIVVATLTLEAIVRRKWTQTTTVASDHWKVPTNDLPCCPCLWSSCCMWHPPVVVIWVDFMALLVAPPAQVIVVANVALEAVSWCHRAQATAITSHLLRAVLKSNHFCLSRSSNLHPTVSWMYLLPAEVAVVAQIVVLLRGGLVAGANDWIHVAAVALNMKVDLHKRWLLLQEIFRKLCHNFLGSGGKLLPHVRWQAQHFGHLLNDGSLQLIKARLTTLEVMQDGEQWEKLLCLHVLHQLKQLACCHRQQCSDIYTLGNGTEHLQDPRRIRGASGLT